MGATIESQHNKITRNTRSGGDDERDGEAVGRGRERGTVASLRQGAENRAHGKWGGGVASTAGVYALCRKIMLSDTLSVWE